MERAKKWGLVAGLLGLLIAVLWIVLLAGQGTVTGKSAGSAAIARIGPVLFIALIVIGAAASLGGVALIDTQRVYAGILLLLGAVPTTMLFGIHAATLVTAVPSTVAGIMVLWAVHRGQA